MSTLHRLQLMSPGEILWRLADLPRSRLRYWLRGSRRPRVLGGEAAFEPLLDRGDMDLAACRRYWESESWHDEVLDETLRHRFRCAHETHDLGERIDWHFDPTTGARVPLIHGRKYLFLRMYRAANMVYLRTLNRHYHLVHLAKGQAVRGRGGEEIAAQVLSWIDANPYLEGINWSDPLDVAVRLLHWSLAFTFAGSTPQGEVGRRIAESVAEQSTFIEEHLSRYSSANNHIVGEHLGLLVAGLCFPGLRRARRWRETGQQGLEREIRRQWTDDGVHREGSLSYQRWLLEPLVLVWAVCRRRGFPFSAECEERIRRGVDYVGQALNPAGEVPFLGDHGHESTVDTHYQSFWTTNCHHSLLRLAARLGLHRDETLSAIGGEDARVVWMSPAAEVSLPAGKHPIVRESRAFTESGFYFLRDGRPFDEETCLTFRAGPMGFLSLCAHAHADQLAFTLSVRGRQFLIDPGTYGYYVMGERWRNYFRGTRAHNTLTVDGIDQARSGGNMMWLDKARGAVLDWYDDVREVLVAGEHDGYRRLRDPVLHRREVKLDKDRKRIETLDRLDARGEHTAELNLHFHPEVAVTAEGPNRFRAEREGRTLVVTLDPALEVRLLRGDEEEPAGWYSPYFGIKHPCVTLRGIARWKGSMRLATAMEYGGD